VRIGGRADFSASLPLIVLENKLHFSRAAVRRPSLFLFFDARRFKSELTPLIDGEGEAPAEPIRFGSAGASPSRFVRTP
jgi:hypothetical protein